MNPSPAICAKGIGGRSHSQYRIEIEEDGKKMKVDSDKPEYRVPTMAEIREMPWNGIRVASTFSGAGGSCTGYRMAGCKVVWANEFVPAAQESYKANAAYDCYLDCRDIREVKPEDIPSDIDIFDGSPPCQAFSTAGKREKGWGKEKKYEHGASQCNENLFFEYIRLLRGVKPRVFIAENVSGLLKGTAKGMFLEILKELKLSGYRVKCKLLDAQWLGVPQQRQRAIFIGVREDLEFEPVFPKPLKYRYSVGEAIPYIKKAYHEQGVFKTTEISKRHSPAVLATQCRINLHDIDITNYAIGKEWDKLNPGESSKKYLNLKKNSDKKPSFCVTAKGGESPGIASITHPFEKRKFTISELKRICAFPDDFILTGKYAQQWERLGNSVPPVMMCHIASKLFPVLLQNK